MADLQSYTCSSVVEAEPTRAEYPQAIRVGDIIHVSGQHGRLPNTTKSALKRLVDMGELDIPRQIDQAFVNVDLVLRAAGGKGWEQVYRVRSYHIDPNNEDYSRMTWNFRKWTPTRPPVWTALPLARTRGQDPKDWVVIEVEAYDPEGAKRA